MSGTVGTLRCPRVWVAIALVLLPGLARGADLVELAKRTRVSVVHLSILGPSGEETASGSGFVVSSDGRVVTNYHVIEGARTLRAKLDGARSAAVRGVLGFDADGDVAVLQLEGSGYTPLALGSSKRLRVGDPVIVIGSPLGLSGTLSTGIVSALRPEGAGDPKEREENAKLKAWSIQVTAAISPGSSGSPIMTEDGEVVAIAVGQVTHGQALNFGVPIERAQELLKRLPAGAPVKPLPAGAGVRSVSANLLISAVVFALLGVGLWVTSRPASKRTPRHWQ